MSLPRLFIKATLPLASIFLILVGIMQLRAQIWTLGAICLILALIGFILSMRLLEQSPFTNEEIETLHPFVIPSVLWTIVFSLLSISVFYVADNFKSADTDRVAAITWVVSVILGLVIVWWKWKPMEGTSSLLGQIRTNRIELVCLLLVLLLALAVRTLDLTNHPYPWSGDEASIGTEGMRILDGEVTNFFETGWSSQPNWSFVPTAITEAIFGRSILAVRLPSALAGVLAVLFVYLTGRELFNPTVGLAAGAFLATLPYNIHFSRVGVHNVVDSLMSALVFWLLARAIRTSDTRDYYSAGIAAGLCIYSYAGTRLALILAGFVLLFVIVRQRGYLRSHWRQLLAFAIAVVISVAPLALFFARHPDIFIGRLGQEGILFNGWLAQQATLTGKSVWEILYNQFTRTVMVFIASPAPGNFFNSPQPYLTLLGSILFVLGMGYSLAYFLEPRYFTLLVWFWAVILFGGILTLNPPANTRMLMTAPVVALLMALGASKILEYLQRFRILPGRLVIPVLVVIVLSITYQNAKFYMVDYRKGAYFADANGEYAMELGLMAKQRGADLDIFVLGAPRIFSGFPTLAFLAPENPRSDLAAENIETLELPAGREVGFFAIPENRPQLEQIAQKFPGGESGLVYRRTVPNEVLFEYYILPPQN
ncbi:MAG TPA: glycosyltransferase family 39 protein [Anaerolineales bacterium]|nr:glycosyltransferase family 39 protein [Anaerolineales bacterium]